MAKAAVAEKPQANGANNAGNANQQGYAIARTSGACAVTQRAFAPGEKFMAALRETPVGFERVDVSVERWNDFAKDDLVAFWQATMPQGNQKKPLFVDDTVLCDLFERLADVQEPAKLNFRFVLGLILMRKRLLQYDTTRRDGDAEFWQVKLKGREGALEMLNPHLDESQMQDVGQQLGEILNEQV
jgi:hypothetical protein